MDKKGGKLEGNISFQGNLPNKEVFNKTSLNIEEQINLLEERGLEFNNRDTARLYLSRISYYHLSGYSRIFYDGSVDQNFIKGTTFKQISELYNFDKDLRSILLQALEVIEVGFKTNLINTLSTEYNPHWFTEHIHFATRGAYNNTKKIIDKELDKQRPNNIFIKHYYDKYGSPFYPPSRMLFQLFSFGDTGNIYKSLNQKNKSLIGKNYDIHKSNLESRIDCLSYLRNICAHSDRVWNRRMTKKVNIKGYEKLFNSTKYKKLYVIDKLWSYIIIIIYFMKKLVPENKHWTDQFIKFIKTHNKIKIESMGFPTNWEKEINNI